MIRKKKHLPSQQQHIQKNQSEDALLQLPWPREQDAFAVWLSLLSHNLQKSDEIRKFWSSSQRPFYSYVKSPSDNIFFLLHNLMIAWKCISVVSTRKFILKWGVFIDEKGLLYIHRILKMSLLKISVFLSVNVSGIWAYILIAGV